MQRQQQRRQQQPGPHKASALDDSSRNRHGSGDFEDCQTFDNEVLYGSSASASSNQVSSSTAPVEGNSDRNASRGSSTSSTSSNRGAVRRKAKQVTTAFKLKNLFMARSASAPTMRKNSGSIFNRNPAPSNTGRGSERAASNSDSSSPADSRGATLERRSSDPVKKPPLLPPPLDGAALTQKLKDSFHELHGILKKWRNEARPGADDAHRKELSEVLEVQVKMGQISSAEMMEILNKDDRAAADKVGTVLGSKSGVCVAWLVCACCFDPGMNSLRSLWSLLEQCTRSACLRRFIVLFLLLCSSLASSRGFRAILSDVVRVARPSTRIWKVKLSLSTSVKRSGTTCASTFVLVAMGGSVSRAVTKCFACWRGCVPGRITLR